MKRDFPEKTSGGDENNDAINLVAQIIEVEGDNIEAIHMKLSERHIDMLGDNGAQVHVTPPSPWHNYTKDHGIVKIHNGETVKTYHKDDYSIIDEVGNDFLLAWDLLKVLLSLSCPNSVDDWKLENEE